MLATATAETSLRPPRSFIPAGFFVLRTPLLAFDEILTWGEGMRAPDSVGDSARLGPALDEDRCRLRERLRSIFGRPEIREALFIASADLEAAIPIWEHDPLSERGKGIEQALVRYFLRMGGRATPFGLCAGSSMGAIGTVTQLRVAGRSQWQRQSQLDFDYLQRLATSLAADPGIQQNQTYRPNSSLYCLAGRWRYAEERMATTGRFHSLAEVAATEALDATLLRAREGATARSLAAALTDNEVSLEDAKAFVDGLITEQILVPEITPAVTGPETTQALIAQLHRLPAAQNAARALEEASTQLASLDRAGLGQSPHSYREIAKTLSDLPAEIHLSHLVRVQMVKRGGELTLGGQVLRELIRAVEILHRLARPMPSEQDELTRFRDAFAARYGTRWIPLVEAVDGDVGLGFPLADDIRSDASPLLRGLPFPASPAPVLWDSRERFLLRMLARALEDGSREIVLSQEDLNSLADHRLPELPETFAVIGSVAAASEFALNRGDFRIWLAEASGPPGAALMGRFCHGDSSLHGEVKRYLRAEEALHPEAIFAEIVHLPEGLFGNVIARPVLRDYEIPYLGRSGIANDRQITITDLHLAIREQRLVLYSLRLNREIIPRLTCAHNYMLSGLPIYRFLCLLQRRHAASLRWDWGLLQNAPFLPRVATGKTVLARAQWTADRKELHDLDHSQGSGRYRAVQNWRKRRRLPRFVALADGDNHLPLDLDNVLCVDTLVDRIKGAEEAKFVEVFPTPDLLVATGAEGRYVHEIVVPFARTIPNGATSVPAPVGLVRDAATARVFAPGSEWINAKFYAGPVAVDRLLRGAVASVVAELNESGAVDRWFFSRDLDPGFHLRVRFHENPERTPGEALRRIQTVAAALLRDGLIAHIEFVTYEREIESYGGPEGIRLAERIFHADSEAVIEILNLLEAGEAGLDERWRLAFKGADALLTDFGLDLRGKSAVVAKLHTNLAREFGSSGDLKGEIGQRFRKERQTLGALLAPVHTEASSFAPGLEILRRRSLGLVPIVAELSAVEKCGRLGQPMADIASGCLRAHANRLLRSAARAHELVLYDFLVRYYGSQLARLGERQPSRRA